MMMDGATIPTEDGWHGRGTFALSWAPKPFPAGRLRFRRVPRRSHGGGHGWHSSKSNIYIHRGVAAVLHNVADAQRASVAAFSASRIGWCVIPGEVHSRFRPSPTDAELLIVAAAISAVPVAVLVTLHSPQQQKELRAARTRRLS